MKLAKRVERVSPSLTLAITAKAKKLRSEGVDIVSFAAGEPDFDTPSHIKGAAMAAIKEGFTKYTPASGMLELKEAVSKKLECENGLVYPPPSISISCGAKHSLYNIFQAICQEGDEVIIPSPYWLSYPEMVKLAGATPVFVQAHEENGFRVNIDDLKKALTKNTKALILNSPSNPTGSIYGDGDLKEIADLAVSKGIAVVSDEIYEKIIYDGQKHTSIASLGNKIKDISIVVNGVSKSYSMTGWRIGYIAAPSDVIVAINKIQSHSTSNPASISQKAALEAITGDQTSVKDMVKEFSIRRDLITGGLSKIKGFKVFKPQGAFYVFCNITGTKIDSLTLTNRLLDEASVAVIPGRPFGSDSHIRLSFANSSSEIKKGLDRIGKWVKEKL
ncbi:MAG: pyridoxal phosphate-dependent aminotransferase [Candidatus Omnitrophica bacterium]|nr:pyridoxal phosphate-dependent aminotransferase [Candidatus Omnitrophota bacterium]